MQNLTPDFSYNGFEVRRYEGWSVSISDLWKIQGKPSSFRPDKWASTETNKWFLNEVAHRWAGTPTPVWIVVKGPLQGTFAAPEVAVRYAKELDPSLGDWLQNVLDEGMKASPIKAKHRTIGLGPIPLAVFQLVTGEYRLSQTQAAEAVRKDERSFREFLTSKSPEALPYRGFQSAKLPVEGSNVPINPIPVKLATAYWTKEAIAGNESAIRLLSACAIETIERRADKAFGVTRTEEDYNERFKDALERFVEFQPDYVRVIDPACGSASMFLAEQELLRKLKRKFPREIIRFPKQNIIQDFVLLGAEAGWHLNPERCLAYPKGAANKHAYPDLISEKTSCLIGGKEQSLVLLLQYVDSIVDETHVKDCVYLREYIDLVKKHYLADHGLLFFVSPYGITRYAAACIKEKSELRTCVGSITVKQLAQFLVFRASENKKDNIRIGKLKKKFRHLVDYKMLDEILTEEELNNVSVQKQTIVPIQLNLFAS